MSQNKWQVLQWAGRLVRFVSLASLSSKFGWGKVSPVALDPEQGDEPRTRTVKLLQSFGFRSSPKIAGNEGLLLAPRAGASNGVAVCVDNFSVGPTDLKEGESVMYGAGGSTLKHDEVGKITVDSAATRDVVFNGGSRTVSCVDDNTSSGSLTFAVFPDPGIPANFVFQVTAVAENGATQVLGFSAPGASASAATTSNPLIFSIVGKVTGPGATRVKG